MNTYQDVDFMQFIEHVLAEAKFDTKNLLGDVVPPVGVLVEMVERNWTESAYRACGKLLCNKHEEREEYEREIERLKAVKGKLEQ